MANALWGDDAALDAARDALGEADLVAPHLIDIELAHVARRNTLLGHTDPTNAMAGLRKLARFPRLKRVPHVPLLERIWTLRTNITAYDASYVALAEALDLPLVTRDLRLARTAARWCEVVAISS